MRTIFLAFAILFGFVARTNAQFNFPVSVDTGITKIRFEVDGLLDIQGTSVRKSLFSKLIFGGQIDESTKDRSFNSHKEINRFGLNVNNEIRYFHGKGRAFGYDSISWAVKGGYFAIGNITYGQDLFGLTFYGNSAYLAQTAIFTNTRFNFTQFQKIGGGIFEKRTGSSVFLNVVNIQNYADGFVRKGELTQNEDGSQIDLVLSGDFSTTKGAEFSKGIGVVLDVDYRINVPWIKNSKTQFQLLAQNLGFARINSGLTRYEVDSNYTYSGFELDQFRNGSNPFGADFSILDSLGIQKTSKKSWVKLPGYIQAMKLIDFQSSKKWQSFFGIRLYPTLNTVPSIFGGVFWKPITSFGVSSSVAYGGFGGFRTGIYATYVSKSIQISIGTEDVIGLVSQNGFGQSLITRIKWDLN